VHHFKWDSNVKFRLKMRRDAHQRRGSQVWRESQRMLDYLESHGDRFDLNDPILGIETTS